MTPREGVHGERDAREERAHLVREVGAAAAFDDEMQVIVLHGIVQDTQAVALGALDDPANRRADTLHAEARAERHPPHRDVHGMTRLVRLARDVREKPVCAPRLAPRRAP
ncbi:MAG: hypothetical protein U0270_43220 [Labilithrix sp.]